MQTRLEQKGKRITRISLAECLEEAMVSQRPPSVWISSATRPSFSAVRPEMTTCAPSLASSCATQRPMPLPPPVTQTTWPANRSGWNTLR